MLRKTLTAALLMTLAAAAPAMADSIAYVDKGDIWLATPDGARKVQVTHTGGYFNVSQADDGTLAALVGGEKLQKLSRNGQGLAEFATPVSDGAPVAGPVNQSHGPFNPQISPDGTKIAYEYFNDFSSKDPSCTDVTVPRCYVYTQSHGVGISYADRFTNYDEFGLLTGWIYPVWM